MTKIDVTGTTWTTIPTTSGKKYVGQNQSNSNLYLFEGSAAPVDTESCFCITPYQTFRVQPVNAVFAKSDTKSVVIYNEVF